MNTNFKSVLGLARKVMIMVYHHGDGILVANIQLIMLYSQELGQYMMVLHLSSSLYMDSCKLFINSCFLVFR